MNGLDCDKLSITENLDIHKEYEVDFLAVSGFYTGIHLCDFHGPFNSVCFEGVDFDLDEKIDEIWEEEEDI
jgi:hypothetical protein